MRKARTDDHAAQRVRAHQYRPPAELYDLNNDPWELNNLVAHPAYTARIAKLSGQLEEWMRQTGDKQSVFGPPTYPPSTERDPSPKPPAAKP